MMLDTSHKKARFSLRKTALGLLSALLGIFLLSAYLPNHTNSLVYAQENVSQNRSVTVHYVLESDLTEQEKLAVQSGFPNHTNDGDSIYFVYQPLKQELPQTSDDGLFWLSMSGLALAGGSFMAMKGRKQGKGLLGLSLVLLVGLSVTASATWSEQLSFFNQSLVLNEHEELPYPQDIDGYRYIGYICKSVSMSNNLSKSNVTSNVGETEKMDAISDTVTYSVLPKDAPTLDLPIHTLSESSEYEVVPTGYPTASDLPIYDLSADTEYTVTPDDSPVLDLPIHPLSLEEVYEVVPSDYPIASDLPIYDLSADTEYTVIPDASLILDLPIPTLSETSEYEVVPTDYPIVEPLPTHELTTDAVYTVIPEDSPSVDLPIHPLSLEEVYEVVPSDYPIVDSLPTYELSSESIYTVVPEDAPSVDLPIHPLSVEEVYEVVPSDYPIVDPLPTYELSSESVYTVVPEDAPSVDLPIHTLSETSEYEVVPTDYPTVSDLPTYELSADTEYTVIPDASPVLDLPEFDLTTLPQLPTLNSNWASYVAEDGSERRILWAKGVKGPRMGSDGDFKKSVFGDFVDYKAPFVLDNGWYDANKRRDGDSRIDASLCFAAVSTNMLYWWLNQNKEEVGRYLEELEQSGHFDQIEANTIKDLRYLVAQPGVQQNSTIYNLFVNYFYDKFNGYQSDILMDFFINGYAPKPGGGTNDEDQDFVKDQRAGFFNAIFGNKKLTRRQFSGSYQNFSQTVKTALENNQLIGMEHLLSPVLNHIVTLWGAEFDANNRLVAVYVTNSDDQDEYRQLGMKRYSVKDVGGRVKVSTNLSQPNHGSNVEYLHILSLGKENWKAYFEAQP